jgi:DNA-binding IclR family transcriptional regulator
LNLEGDDPLIKVLHKAFDILENMSAHKDRAFSLTELAEMIGEKPTTCANIVKTLCDRGYLCRAEPRGYTLGPVAQGLNYVDLADTKLVESSREPMTRLVQKYGASGVLAVLRRGKKKILDDYNSESEFIINKTVRRDHELYTTSTGLVLTSQGKTAFTDGESDIICATYGSVEKMLEIRRFIAEHGYIAISLRPRVFEIAAAVYRDGKVYASIAVYLPEFLIGDAEKDSLIKEICEIANKISERI